MKMKPNFLTDRLSKIWRKFWDESFPDLICYGLMALTFYVLLEHGNSSSIASNVTAGLGAMFLSIYISFAVQRMKNDEIGRASCRERVSSPVYISGVDVELKKKKEIA